MAEIPLRQTAAAEPAVPAGGVVWWHLAAAALLLTGLVAQIWRPLAPDLGVAPPAGDVFSAEYLARAAAYRQPLYVAAVLALLLRIGVAVAAAVTPWGRAAVGRLVSAVGERRPARAAAAVITAIVVVTDLAIAPIAFWAGFVHDGRFGLRSQGFGGWVYDWLVAHLPVWAGVATLTLLGYAVARRWPRVWPAVAGLGVGLLGAAVSFAAPLVLEPLSFSFTELPPGPVRAEVQRVLDAADLDVRAILVADASRRSVRQNAYVSGLGASRRVVLYDTLIAERPVEEVGIVLAHELAHDRHADRLRSVLFAASGGVVSAYLLAALVRRRVAAGLQDSQTDPRAAAVVLLVALLLNVVSTPLQSLVSRRAEAAADLSALDYTAAPDTFAAMQRGLAETNLADPQPPRVITLWRGTHPTTMARIGMTRWWAAQ